MMHRRWMLSSTLPPARDRRAHRPLFCIQRNGNIFSSTCPRLSESYFLKMIYVQRSQRPLTFSRVLSGNLTICIPWMHHRGTSLYLKAPHSLSQHWFKSHGTTGRKPPKQNAEQNVSNNMPVLFTFVPEHRVLPYRLGIFIWILVSRVLHQFLSHGQPRSSDLSTIDATPPPKCVAASNAALLQRTCRRLPRRLKTQRGQSPSLCEENQFDFGFCCLNGVIVAILLNWHSTT